MPNVSVVLPTYNRKQLVQETIDSVLRQTYTDFELIIVDDGSTDDTGDALASRYGSRIRYVYQENQGESAARNHGIDLAKGTYVAFIDSDDLWHEDKLMRQMEVAEAHPELGIVSTQAYWINYRGMKLQKPPDGSGRQSSVITWSDLVLDNVISGGGSSALVLKKALDRAEGFDASIRFGEEWDLWIRIAHDHLVHEIPTPLVYYRLNPFGTRSWAPRAAEADQLYTEHLAIVGKAFERPACAPEDRAGLEAQAYGRLHLRQALVSYGHGNVEKGRHYWQVAIEACPQYATDRQIVGQTVTDYVTGFAGVAEPSARLKTLEAMVTRVVSHLPEPMAPLKAEHRSLLAGCFAEMAFQAALNQETHLARRSAYHCCRVEPSWLRNRGLLKILATGGRHLWPDTLRWESGSNGGVVS
jgi:hypothetical protein